jgi:hypothetical protein
MINFIVKNAIKKIAIKIATDKDLRNKMKTGVSRAQELNSKGELMKTLGKSVGRLKNKIKR